MADRPLFQQGDDNAQPPRGRLDVDWRWKPVQPGQPPQESPKPGTGGGQEQPPAIDWRKMPTWRTPVPDFRPQVPAPDYRPVEPLPGAVTPIWRTPVPDIQRRPGVSIVPTLRSGEAADEKDRTVYKPSDKAAQIYDQTKDAIVKIDVTNREAGQRFSGTGFFISEDGKLATAYHVVSMKGDITVQMSNGRTLKANLVDVKPQSDVAVLQVEGAAPNERFKALELEKTSRDLPLGIDVYIVGHPRGWQPAFVSEGKLIGRDRLGSLGLEHPVANPNRMLLSTSTHVEKGNSGSPLMNKDGKVIGVLSFGDSAYTGNSDAVEDLNTLLGKNKTSDYFPNSLQFDTHTARDLASTSLAGLNLVMPRLSANARLNGFTRGAAGWLAGASAINDLTSYDIDAFVNSWTGGSSTAEKFSSTVNFGGDVSMLIGAGLMLGGSKYRTAASLLIGSGSLAKFLNGIGADRAY